MQNLYNCDQDIRQLEYVVYEMDNYPEKSGPQLLKQISILDAIYWVTAAWDEVQEDTITKCFAKCGFEFKDPSTTPPASEAEDAEDESDNYPVIIHKLASELFGCEFSELPKIDENLCTCDTQLDSVDNMSAVELLAAVRKDCGEGDSEATEVDSEDDEELPAKEPVTNIEVAQAISVLESYAIEQGLAELHMDIIRIRDQVTQIRVQASAKQSKVTDFFKPI